MGDWDAGCLKVVGCSFLLSVNCCLLVDIVGSLLIVGLYCGLYNC